MQRSRALVLVGCLGALVLAFAVPAAQAAPWPGPDTFGYRGESSAGAFPHKWNSIVGVPGSTQVFLTDDSYTGPVPIGFTFRHYDGLFTDAYLASNGYITLSATSATTISGTLPSVAAPHGVIAGAWTDWNPGCNTGTLHYGTFGTAPNRYFVYQFTDIDRYSYCGGAPEGTFQIILHEGGWVEMQYLSLALPIGSVTIGIENFAGNDGLTYLNSAGATTLTGFALRYYTNAAPQLRDDEAVAVEDQGTITIDVLGNDKDPEGDPIDIVSVTQPLKGTAAITGKFPNEKVTYKPHPDQNTALQAMDSFTYRVTDGQGNFAEATVQVLVEPVNDPPTYKVLPLAFAREDEPAKVEGWAYDFWLGPTEDEVATQAMRFDIEADPPGVALFRA
ncbi:MAG TPA: cadherin-like domain-containing protein, partial [Candidatus Thermoplasmatota archaeon]|nr:cadherin-like domain-containing protein [Candidatus Thermoplasmatota archaeon]